MEAAALAVDRLATGHDTRSSGLVRLTTLEMLAHQVILPALATLLDKHPQPTLLQIQEGLSGNLCRCTGYMRIFKAVQQAGTAGAAK